MLEMEGHSRTHSNLIKRSIIIRGHKTSISLENIFWEALKTIAIGRRQSISALVGEIEQQRDTSNLSSATRVFVLRHFRGLIAA
jgi:predicted DNA-binding ribbon-helix-helix protein